MTVMSWKLFLTQYPPRKNYCSNLSISTEILTNLCCPILLDPHLSNNDNFIDLQRSGFQEKTDAAATKHSCNICYCGNHMVYCNQNCIFNEVVL